MPIKYQYAYDENNNIVNISDAVKGTLYHCISCNDILITKQGKIKQWHFAHKHEQDSCSVESYLHKLAKQRFYDIYTDCLNNNNQFNIALNSNERYLPCAANGLHNICKECNYRRIRTENFDLTKWFKNIEIERTVDDFRADVCLSKPDDSEKIFIEIHVTNKISEHKKNSNHRIIEIDIKDEDDIKALDTKILSPSEKIRFINFKKPKKTVPNDGNCNKEFLLLFLNKNGGAQFRDKLKIENLNKKISEMKNNWVEYQIVSPGPYYEDDEIYEDFESCWDFYNGAHEYKKFIANCATKNLNVKSCFICRYHAEADSMWSAAPIFCKHLRKECKSTEALNCGCFKKEEKYIKALLETGQESER